jgi:hypothetical protein
MEKKSLYAAAKNKDPIKQILLPRMEQILLECHESSTTKNVKILEIASGTGEHCHYFLSELLRKLSDLGNAGSVELDYQPTEPDSSMQESIVAWSKDISPENSVTEKHEFASCCVVPSSPTRLLKQATIFNPILLDLQQYHDTPDLIQEKLSSQTFHKYSVNIMICINMIHITPLPITYYLFDFASEYLQQNRESFLITYGAYSFNGNIVPSNQKFHEDLQSRNPLWGIKDIELLKVIASERNLVLDEIIDMPSNNHCLLFRRKLT